MKEWIIAIIGLILVTVGLYGATGRAYEVYTITNTGTTGINFSKISKEIYVVNRTTGIAYVDFISSYGVVGTDFMFQRDALTAPPAEHTEEVESSWMAVRQDTGPVNIGVLMKHW